MLAPVSPRTLRVVRLRFAPALAIALAAVIAFPASAQTLYKWTDANGRVVYSDQPPPGNVKVEIIGGAPPPSNPNAVREMAAKEQQITKRLAEKANDGKKSEKTRADDEVNTTACKTLRLQILQLNQSQIVLYKLNEKGEQETMDDAERAKQLAQAARLLRDYQCPPA